MARANTDFTDRAAGTSLWTETLPPSEVFSPERDASVVGDSADVVIVGAGYTGLWTARELLQRDPSLRVTVLERHRVGFGASGRNGGWSSAILPMSLERIATRHGKPAATRLQATMHDTVGRIVDFVAERDDLNDAADDAAGGAAGGAAGVAHLGGTIDIARNAAQERRLRSHVDEMRHFGFGSADYRFVDAGEASRWCAASATRGGAVTPHCAVVHPLRLVHALARDVAARGGRIVEGVTVTDIESTTRGPRLRARLSGGETVTVDGDLIVQATEAYSCELPHQRRTVLPIYSMMIATEPLSPAVWDEIGLSDRPTFADGRQLIVYGQRSADGRLVFGGRGAPYHFGSKIDPSFDTDPRIAKLLRESLVDLFPAVADVAITHHWGGVLAAPRDWTCSVRVDRHRGLAVAGGYVGDGVTTAALAGATLAELVVPGEHRELATLPIVGHRSRRWEVEPVRWLGVNTARWTARRADAAEQHDRSTARLWTGLTRTLLRR